MASMLPPGAEGARRPRGSLRSAGSASVGAVALVGGGQLGLGVGRSTRTRVREEDEGEKTLTLPSMPRERRLEEWEARISRREAPEERE
eukprot:scaffold2941_cov22-Tisochrysis_lutea.AAC.3